MQFCKEFSKNIIFYSLYEYVWYRVESRAGIFGRAGFGLEFVEMFRADFGFAYKTFLQHSE